MLISSANKLRVNTSYNRTGNNNNNYYFENYFVLTFELMNELRHYMVHSCAVQMGR